VAGDAPVHVVRARNPEVAMRWVWVLLFVWLLIGALAAGQRDYYTSSSADCAGVGTIVATILFGPINYLGANPKITCH
jgi:membrane protein YdbS with pleckstrin-like domain